FRQTAAAGGGRGIGGRLGGGSADGKTRGDRCVASRTRFSAQRGGAVERNARRQRREPAGGLDGAETFAPREEAPVVYQHQETFRSEEHTSELQSRENLVCR